MAMEQVSSFLENILAVEPDDTTSKRASMASTSSGDGGPIAKRRTRSTSSNISVLDINAGRRLSVSHGNPDATRDILTFWFSDHDDKKNNVMADKLMEKMISMIIPVDTEEQKIISDRLVMQAQRPLLSMNIMSKNSIELNQRMSSIFNSIDDIIKFIAWYNPYYTIGVLLIVTHVILNPYLGFSLPIIMLLNNVLVPHYLELYPPDHALDGYLDRNPIPYEGDEPLGVARLPKPVPQFSREFLLNLTDLQNHMILYIKGYDALIWLTKDYLFFKDENISTIVYLGLFAASIYSLVVLPQIMPWLVQHFPLKLVLILWVWLGTLSFHPSVRELLLDWLYNEDTRLNSLNIVNRVEQFLLKFLETTPRKDQDEMLVEIFELHKLNGKTHMWELVGFGNEFYAINNPIRQLNKKLTEEYDTDLHEMAEKQSVFPHDEEELDSFIAEDDDVETLLIKKNSKQRIDDIQAPRDYEFSGDRWMLDLEVNSWVEQKYIEGLVNIDSDEKWVYDFATPDTGTGEVFRRRRWVRSCHRKRYGAEPTDAGPKVYNPDRFSKSFSNFLLT